MGITLKQLTDTVSLIKDYVLHKTDKINQISIAQKTVNTNLDSCFCKLENNYTPVVGEYVPFVKTSGSFEVQNGRVIIKPGQRIQINISLSYALTTEIKAANICYVVKDYTNDINIVIIQPFHDMTSLSYEYDFTQICQYTNETDKDCEIGLYVNDINVPDALSPLSSMTVQEIGRQVLIDPVEYINTTQGIEDTPVGHIISHMGTTAPKHYLICDGTEYGITDYPYLAQHIEDNFGSVNFFGGDGVNTFAVPKKENIFSWFSPKMTSNNTPSNYEVTASSIFSSVFDSYKAFNGIINDDSDSWHSAADGSDNHIWIAFNFGTSKITNGIRLYPRSEKRYDQFPISFDIEGSNDGITWKNIKSFSNLSSPTSLKWQEFLFDKAVNYQHYRLYNLKSATKNQNLYDYVSIGEMEFQIANEFQCIKYEPTYYMQVETQSSNYLQFSDYSLEERVVGRWLNGKPIYEKTFNLTTPSDSGGILLKKIDGIEIISIAGFVKTSSIQNVPVNYAGSSYVGTHQTSEGHIYMVMSGSSERGKPCVLTLRYTKIEDPENSFTPDMIKDFVLGSSSSSDGNDSPSYGTGPSCNCPTYTNDEVEFAIEAILTDEEPEEEVTENTPATIPELYPEMEDIPTVIPEIIEDEVQEEVTEPEETQTEEIIE